jgi:hypothetical protein
VYKDAFRELGLLEMCVSCLQKFANMLKEKHVTSSTTTTPINNESEINETTSDNNTTPVMIQIDPYQRELGFLIMDIVTQLIAHNMPNARLFRELGGARIAHNMVPYKICRAQALTIVSTLLLTTAGEDDMCTLLGLMHTAELADLELKNAVLRALLGTLRESHRTRTVFRRAGGFVYVVSVLISMEGALSVPVPRAPWHRAHKAQIFAILKTILNTLTVSMRYEPANAKFFETEVKWKSLCAALKLLGCFDAARVQFESTASGDFFKQQQRCSSDLFETFFCNLDEASFGPGSSGVAMPSNVAEFLHLATMTAAQQQQLDDSSDELLNQQLVDEKLVYVCYIMRFLYDTAMDTFDK